MRTVRIIAIATGVSAAALLAQLSLLSYGLYVLIVALVTSELIALYSLDRVACIRDVRVDRAKIGEKVSVATIVRNDKPLPIPWMLIEDSLPKRLPVEGESARFLVLRPFGDARLEYTVTMTHRGYHQIGPVVLESGDLFGFVRRFRAARAAHYVTVPPDVVPILKYDIATRRPIGEVRVRRLLFEDPSRMVGVRDYHPGDSLNRIHWRATARTGQLHSKVYEQSTLTGALLALDFHRAAYERPDAVTAGRLMEDVVFDRSELAIKVAASIAGYLVSAKQEVGLISNGLDAAERAKRAEGEEVARSRREARALAAGRGGGDRLRPVEVPARKGHDQAMRVLDALARLELSEGLPIEDMLAEEYVGMPRDLALVLIVPTLTPRLYEILARLKLSGFAVTTILVDHAPIRARAHVTLAAQNIDLIHIERPEDLMEIARSGL